MKHYTAEYMLVGGEVKQNWFCTVADGRFAAVGPERPAGSVTDLGHTLMMPGLVNTHTHSMQSLMRGFGDDCDLLVWLRERVYRYCERMDEDMVYTAALLTFAEMACNGITSVVDFFYLNRGGNDCARAVIQAARDVGIRLVLARAMMDWENAPDCIREPPAVAEKNFLNLSGEFCGREDTVRICPAPHSAYGASSGMISLAHELSASLDIPCHMHVSDSRSAMELVRAMTGRDYVDYLDSLGVLDKRFVAVHCIWCGERAQNLLARADVKVSHNPVSNMFLGEPAAPIVELMKRNVVVGLGTDGAASNNRLSILQEMKFAAMQQKSCHGDPQAIRSGEVVAMATENGDHITGFGAGMLAVDRKADFLVIDLADPALNPLQMLRSHIAYALSEKAIAGVYVGGERIVDREILKTVDIERLRATANKVVAGW